MEESITRSGGRIGMRIYGGHVRNGREGGRERWREGGEEGYKSQAGREGGRERGRKGRKKEAS